jgi:hypothetical protein
MVAGITAHAATVPDQQVATWNCYYQVDDDSVFASKGDWIKHEYTLSVSGGNFIAVDHDAVNNISTTETVSLGKIKDVKGDMDGGHYFITVSSHGKDVTSQLGETSDQENKILLEFLGTDVATYNMVMQKLQALTHN